MAEIVRLPLGQWVVAGDEGVSRLVEAAGSFGYPDNLRDLSSVSFAIPDGAVVIDAGASIGDQTVLYAQMVGIKGHVHACEPHPDSYQALVRNVAHLRNVTAYPVALGAEPGRAGLSLVTPNTGASFLGDEGRFPAEADRDRVFPQVDVDVTTLDHLFSHLTRLDCVHLDAEGMEAEILKGGKELIQRFHPILLVEVTDEWLRRYGSSAMAFMQQLAEAGYSSLLQMPSSPAQFDLIAIPGRLSVPDPAKAEGEHVHAEVS